MLGDQGLGSGGLVYKDISSNLNACLTIASNFCALPQGESGVWITYACASVAVALFGRANINTTLGTLASSLACILDALGAAILFTCTVESATSTVLFEAGTNLFKTETTSKGAVRPTSYVDPVFDSHMIGQNPLSAISLSNNSGVYLSGLCSVGTNTRVGTGTARRAGCKDLLHLRSALSRQHENITRGQRQHL